ncbi:unnamed protein product [Brassica oleracea var. botrytis]
MPVTAGVSEAALATRAKLRGEIGQTKVKRYWPGKAPEWADEPEEDEDVRMQKTRAENREEVRADHRRVRQAEIVYTEEEELEVSRGGGRRGCIGREEEED